MDMMCISGLDCDNHCVIHIDTYETQSNELKPIMINNVGTSMKQATMTNCSSFLRFLDEALI